MQDRECEEIIEMAEGPSVCAPGDEQVEAGGPTVEEQCAYGMKAWAGVPYDELLPRVRHALGERGFLINCELDVREMMRERLGLVFPHYSILSVCVPEMLHQALELDRDMGLMLPFHVIVYEQGGGTVVAAVDAIAQMALADGRDLRDLARHAKERLRAGLDAALAA